MDDYTVHEVLIDSHHGIYVPQIFAERYDANEYHLYGIDPEDIDILLEGPDHEDYWEAWNNVLNDAFSEDGRKYLHQEGDLFLIEWNYK